MRRGRIELRDSRILIIINNLYSSFLSLYSSNQLWSKEFYNFYNDTTRQCFPREQGVSYHVGTSDLLTHLQGDHVGFLKTNAAVHQQERPDQTDRRHIGKRLHGASSRLAGGTGGGHTAPPGGPGWETLLSQTHTSQCLTTTVETSL